MTSTSQDKQDEYVLQKTGYKFGGYFVEIGAYDGIEFSNTHYLETSFGWNGILVECDPMAVSKLKVAGRTKSIIDTRAVWETSGDYIKFKSVEGGKVSGAVDRLVMKKSLVRPGEIITVETVTLDQLLDFHSAPAHINYMSIDTEGSEYNILKNYSFSRTFDVVTIEHLNNKEEIYELMKRNGYFPERLFVSGFETAFVRG